MSAPLGLLYSAFVMSVIVAVRYLLTSGGFAWLTQLRQPGLYAALKPQIKSEIFWSLTSAAIYGIPAGIVAWGWDQRGWTLISNRLADFPLWWWPLSILLTLFLHDTWFYWTHRLMHRPRWFRIAHAVHHDSRPPTAWAAMSFHPIEALTGAIVIPLIVFVIPLHISALATVLTVMTVMGVTNHMGWEMFPKFMVNGPLGHWLITATHHQHHHAQYRGNYGLYFRVWDRICGTDTGLGRFGSDPADSASASR
jgi:Delta7-sterol 5-desaturase